MQTTMMSPGRIAKLHGVRDEARLADLVESMLRSGWTGRPVLAISV